MYALAHLNTTAPSGKAAHSMHQLGLLECSHARGVEENTCVINAQTIDCKLAYKRVNMSHAKALKA